MVGHIMLKPYVLFLFGSQGDQQPTPRSLMYHDNSDTQDDSGEPVPKRSRCDEEDHGDESSDDDMHDKEMEYIFFGNSADEESDHETDEDKWLP
ncbi:Hypothetical predicted protein [Paramuricea clavata]|uniref:Uncharacterized protein n=1 Tax=Paramuricea clavata TaxID=317549 RepID=A0A7D9LVP9_PARCT|nr:Hypothetical predicted protein [Paramuricea clavata]